MVRLRLGSAWVAAGREGVCLDSQAQLLGCLLGCGLGRGGEAVLVLRLARWSGWWRSCLGVGWLAVGHEAVYSELQSWLTPSVVAVVADQNSRLLESKHFVRNRLNL